MTDQQRGPSSVETIKEHSAGLRGAIPTELEAETPAFSEESYQLLKFHGIYQQDDRDVRRARTRSGEQPAYTCMVRAKIPGGVLTAEQYLTFDDLASRVGNETLRITTRQALQLHGVLKGDLRRTIRAINDVLVTTLGACGDVERNVVSCPAPLRGRWRDEALAITRAISDRLLPRTPAYHEIWLNGAQVAGGAPVAEPLYGARYLPRKFKTGLAFPDDNCSDVLANDLGLLAIPDGPRIRGFNVLVGGGLGATHGKAQTYPRLADPLAFVAPGEVVDVAEAIIAVQRDHGDRADRRHARLKYLLDDRGLDWFRARVEHRLGRSLLPPEPVHISAIHDHLGWHEQGNGRWFCGLFVENGRVHDGADAQTRTALRRVVERVHPGVHLTPQQNLLLTDLGDEQRVIVERILAEHGVRPVERVSGVRRWAMACPALPTCGLALAESERVLPGVIDELEREIERLGLGDAQLTVRMTGCPNGCARPYTADIAFVGRSGSKYTIFLGGSMLGTRLGRAYADLVPLDQLVPRVLPLLERYRIEREPGERFGDFCDRVGVGQTMWVRACGDGRDARPDPHRTAGTAAPTALEAGTATSTS